MTNFGKPMVLGTSALNLDEIVNSSSSGGIFPKLDYITMVFYNVSMNFVLNFIHCASMEEDLIKSEFDRNYGKSAWVSYPLSNTGIKLEIKRDQLEKFNGLSVFDRNCDSVRLDISGSGLDFLRQEKEIDVETFFRRSIPVSSDGTSLYKFTRCDLAFDLVNYCPEFLSLFSKHLHGISYSSLKVRGSDRPLQYNERRGSNLHTIYVGATSSDKLLRIYDKAMEFSKHKKKSFLLDEIFPVDHVDSWVRFELQCRNNQANYFLLNFPDYLSVYMWIYDYYAPLANDHEVMDFWFDIWKPDYVPYIIQNLQFVTNVLTKEDIIHKVANNVDDLAFMCANFRLFVKLKQDQLLSLLNDKSAYGSNKRLRFYRALSLLSDGEDLNINWDNLLNCKKVVSGDSSVIIPYFDL